MMSRASVRYRAVSGMLLALFLVGPFSYAGSALSVGTHQSASVPDLSNDDLWDDGFGFGVGADSFSRVYSVAVIDNNVYLGGRFTKAGGGRASGIAKWDGSGWSNVGGGLDNCSNAFCSPTVYALSVKGKDLYAGGNFLSISGLTANRVARWDGAKWSALGDGVQICNINNDCVTPLSMTATETGIYAVGKIITDIGSNGTSTLEGFTKWDGNNWALQGGVTGVNVSVALYAIEAGQARTYVGGVFSAAGPAAANSIASFDGKEWNALGGGVSGCVDAYPGIPCTPYVYTIAILGDDVYVGGGFTSAGGTPAFNLARWDGGRWSAFGEGANGPVLKIAVNRNIIYVGGQFTSIGGVQANGVARFDGDKWSALGSGVNGYVDAIAFKDNEVYLGGSFDKAGGKTAYSFARWIDPTFVAPTPPAPPGPQIAGISVTKKKLTITGERFDLGAVLLLNGEAQKTMNDEQNPTTQLIAKKSGKKIRNGDKLQIQNADGKLSPEFTVTL